MINQPVTRSSIQSDEFAMSDTVTTCEPDNLPTLNGHSANAPGESPPARRGPPDRNQNALKSGLYARPSLGSLPKGASYIRRDVAKLRRAIESAMPAGVIGVNQSLLLNSVCRHESRALLAGRYLAKEGDSLPLADRLALLVLIGQATEARDKALRGLRLNDTTTLDDDPWSFLDKSQSPTGHQATTNGESQ